MERRGGRGDGSLSIDSSGVGLLEEGSGLLAMPMTSLDSMIGL